MKTNFILLFLFTILITSSLFAQKPWPYSQGVVYQYDSDSTGKYLGFLYRRITNIYNKNGKELSILTEINNSKTGGVDLDSATLDSMNYDSKNRLIRKVTYTKPALSFEKFTEYIYQFFDSTYMSAVINSLYIGNNLQNQKWSAVYKNKNGNDSFSKGGEGKILHQNTGGRSLYYYTNKKLDSIVSEKYDTISKQWKFTGTTVYKGIDTVTISTFNSVNSLLFAIKYVYDSADRVIFYDNSSSRYYYKYNKDGKEIERRSFTYDKNQNKYLISYHTISNYDTSGAIIYNLSKSYSGGIFSNANRRYYFYTPFPKDPPKPPKKDSLAAIYNPNPPIDSIKEDSATSSINNGFSQTTFNIFPNPVQNQVFITILSAPKSEIKLYSMDGRLVFSKQIQINQQHIHLDISALKAGMYILRLQGTDGQIQNKVLLKQ